MQTPIWSGFIHLSCVDVSRRVKSPEIFSRSQRRLKGSSDGCPSFFHALRRKAQRGFSLSTAVPLKALSCTLGRVAYRYWRNIKSTRLVRGEEQRECTTRTRDWKTMKGHFYTMTKEKGRWVQTEGNISQLASVYAPMFPAWNMYSYVQLSPTQLFLPEMNRDKIITKCYETWAEDEEGKYLTILSQTKQVERRSGRTEFFLFRMWQMFFWLDEGDSRIMMSGEQNDQ